MTSGDGVLLETARLQLRRFTPADVDALDRINGDPEVMRYIGDGNPWPRAQTEARIRRMLKAYELYPGLGLWRGDDKVEGRFVGAFALFYVPNTVEVEVGYRLDKSAWGRGYATEGARALVRHGLLELGLERVVGLTHPDNEASKRVLMKAGLHPAGMAHRYGRDLCYFVVERNQAQAARASA